MRSKGRSSRQWLTINSDISLSRQRWSGEGQSAYVLDALLERVESTVSLGVREFCTRVGITGGNFDRCAENLWKTAGVKLSGEKFRQVVEAEGQRVQQAHAQEQLEFDWVPRTAWSKRVPVQARAGSTWEQTVCCCRW